MRRQKGGGILAIWLLMAACSPGAPIAEMCESANRLTTALEATRIAAMIDRSDERWSRLRDANRSLLESAVRRLETVPDDIRMGPTWQALDEAAQHARQAQQALESGDVEAALDLIEQAELATRGVSETIETCLVPATLLPAG